ncbi:MAG: SRPBCC domain-containing protein [Actinomycetota bacterium]
MERTAEQGVSVAGGNRDGAVKSADFTIAFTVDQTPEEAFKAINDVRGWWSANIEGPTYELNSEFIFHNEPVHYSRIEVTELVAGKRVAWRILENYMSFVEDKREWIGNEIAFDIARKGDKTEVVFTQIGLVPDYECYDVCSSAWSGYIKGSLRALIVTGMGAPIPEAS